MFSLISTGINTFSTDAEPWHFFHDSLVKPKCYAIGGNEEHGSRTGFIASWFQ